MPRVISAYTDERNNAWCMHCGSTLDASKKSDDHTPSKFLLDRPFPDNLATTEICGPCNSSFSLDEEYFSAFLSVVLSGTTDPDKQVISHAAKTLSHANALRRMIEESGSEQYCLDGQSTIQWTPDKARIQNVILKNARAHLFFENGEPMLDEPEYLHFQPIQTMSEEERADFFGFGGELAPWCEVGSRWNTRLVEGDAFDNMGFLVVQPGVYRFRVEAGGQGLRSVIREYLATTVFW